MSLPDYCDYCDYYDLFLVELYDWTYEEAVWCCSSCATLLITEGDFTYA